MLKGKASQHSDSQKILILEHVYHKPLLDEDELYNTCMEYKKKITPYICEYACIYTRRLKAGQKSILLEGQLGTLKDPDFGIYPMVTSSSTFGRLRFCRRGIPPYLISEVVAVTKAYSSAVGAGEFCFRRFFDEDEAQALRIHGGDKGEFGATTGRPRRVGWFDCVATRYGVECQGATKIAMTALDCLSYLDEIKVCTAYKIGDDITKDFPNTSLL